ncbi:MAG TPA: hypothetical protein VFI31_05190, partial [Pirellulales bacterium]|nr:hypothetical protein [Pirellulales bacterium]
MAIERLEGYAIAAAVVGRWGDHVYVTSSDGSVWPCWGRGDGGTALPGAAGYGEQSVADCISQQFSRAGIAYGLTGVCHQIANRILFP